MWGGKLLFWNLNILLLKVLTWFWPFGNTKICFHPQVFPANISSISLGKKRWGHELWRRGHRNSNTSYRRGALQPNILSQHFRGTPKNTSSFPISPACPECGRTCVHHITYSPGLVGEGGTKYNIIIQLQQWLQQVFLTGFWQRGREQSVNDMVGISMKWSNHTWATVDD